MVNFFALRKLAMVSVDFTEIQALQHQGDGQKTANVLSHTAKSLEAAAADFVPTFTNTMHKHYA
tara:strand:+ start:68 stop:259 length:192 start_codon:yes stop_codon:yes gene_type:complete